jgi:hypothetical protein
MLAVVDFVAAAADDELLAHFRTSPRTWQVTVIFLRCAEQKIDDECERSGERESVMVTVKPVADLTVVQ